VQVAARRAAGRESRRSPSGEKRPGRWQRTAGDLGELEVLRLLAAGLSNRGIAHDLVVALDTVKKHVTHSWASSAPPTAPRPPHGPGSSA